MVAITAFGVTAFSLLVPCMGRASFFLSSVVDGGKDEEEGPCAWQPNIFAFLLFVSMIGRIKKMIT